MTRNEEVLMTMVSSTIVEFHNEYAAQPVKKFQDKATAVRRTAAVLDEAGMEFDDSCQLRPKPAAEEQMPPKLNFYDDKQYEIDSAHMVDEKEPVVKVDLEKLGEFGLGDSEESAECPHCGTNHRDNGYARHGDDYECDEFIHACLACGGEWGPKIQRRASGQRAPQMRLKGQRISLIGGKDAINPYRLGCLSFKAFELMRNNPKATYEELVRLGAQGRTIRHEIKHGRARTL